MAINGLDFTSARTKLVMTRSVAIRSGLLTVVNSRNNGQAICGLFAMALTKLFSQVVFFKRKTINALTNKGDWDPSSRWLTLRSNESVWNNVLPELNSLILRKSSLNLNSSVSINKSSEEKQINSRQKCYTYVIWNINSNVIFSHIGKIYYTIQ